MALSCQNRQTVNKNSNEMAKGPFGKWRFRGKWRIWRKWQKWRLIAKMLTKIQMRWQRGPLQSGDFGENGVFGENGRNGN